MYAVADEAQSGGVGNTERAAKIHERLEALGISDREFADRSGIDRKALRRAANGGPVRGTTYTAIETWLNTLEAEVGVGAPPGARQIGDPADDLWEFTIENSDGLKAVVKGPIRDMDELQAFAQKLIRDMRGDRPPTENGS